MEKEAKLEQGRDLGDETRVPLGYTKGGTKKKFRG